MQHTDVGADSSTRHLCCGARIARRTGGKTVGIAPPPTTPLPPTQGHKFSSSGRLEKVEIKYWDKSNFSFYKHFSFPTEQTALRKSLGRYYLSNIKVNLKGQARFYLSDRKCLGRKDLCAVKKRSGCNLISRKFFFLSVFLSISFSAGSGIPEVRTMLAGIEMPHYLSLTNLFTKLVALVCTLAAGSTIFLGKVVRRISVHLFVLQSVHLRFFAMSLKHTWTYILFVS